MRYVTVAVVALSAIPLVAQSPVREFEVASIKRNTAPITAGPSGTMPTASKGEVRMVNIPVQLLVLRAYPVETLPADVVGLPSWAESERYDATVKGSPDATPDDMREMWRTLLTDRMQLSAHYEPREVRGYNLVMARADRRLGPNLTPSSLDCPPLDPKGPPPRPPQIVTDATRPGATLSADTERQLMSVCRFVMTIGSTIYSGSQTIAGLITSLRFGGLRERIDDHTGLEGMFAFKLTFARGPLGATQSADDAPSIFAALQEQLGLKLEPTTMHSQAVVIDHIERPSEN